MKLGVVYPQTELRGDPEAVRRITLATEELGYDHLLAYDHVVGATHEDRDPPLWARMALAVLLTQPPLEIRPND